MSFLPMTHIFEKAWCYYCLHKGVTIAINQDPKMIQKTLPEVHPTLMCNVPRFWEKVYAGSAREDQLRLSGHEEDFLGCDRDWAKV